MLNLLYEFCLIDSLDIKDIEIEKLVDTEEKQELSKIEKTITKNYIHHLYDGQVSRKKQKFCRQKDLSPNPGFAVV